jgi:uncharacterized Zn finger protein
MTQRFSRTWWGQRFIAALESFTDSARLSRGRSYARNDKVKNYEVSQGSIIAQVRGSVNPYFGVYKEPLYTITIKIMPIKATDWSKAISQLGSRASMISRLLLNEMPDNIDSVFEDMNLHLLPHRAQDFTTTCSCPDWENPCKHIAGVYYLIAAQLDIDPFLLFELRGISRNKLQEELAKSPLGKSLSESLVEREIPLEPVSSYHTKPVKVKATNLVNLKHFWLGEQRLPPLPEQTSQVNVPALVIKKAGDFPPFWSKDTSFLSVMEDFYQRVRVKHFGKK